MSSSHLWSIGVITEGAVYNASHRGDLASALDAAKEAVKRYAGNRTVYEIDLVCEDPEGDES